LLGLQAVGEGDIIRRIDVFAAFMQRKGSLGDLRRFEPGYAPPYADAVDPLHHMAGMAMATSRGTVFVGPEAFEELRDSGACWIDVREPGEFDAAPITVDGITNIPLRQLRDRLGDLPKDSKIVILCQRGSRAYQAAIFLRDAGFDDIVVMGGGRSAITTA
jgi:rhodanese-related sulfurtransferase